MLGDEWKMLLSETGNWFHTLRQTVNLELFNILLSIHYLNHFTAYAHCECEWWCSTGAWRRAGGGWRLKLDWRAGCWVTGCLALVLKCQPTPAGPEAGCVCLAVGVGSEQWAAQFVLRLQPWFWGQTSSGVDKVYLYKFYSSVWPNNKAGEVLLNSGNLCFCKLWICWHFISVQISMSWQRHTYILGWCQERITSWLEMPSFSTTNTAGKCPYILLKHMTHTFEHVGCLQKHKMLKFCSGQPD